MPWRKNMEAKCKKLIKKADGGPDLFGPDRASLMSNNDSHPQDGSAEPAPTVAAFSPNQQTASRTRDQKSVLIHQKSPLLVATPPQVTRALAYSHPFILPLNHIAGLLSWTTDDSWESFLLLTCFWFVMLYGDAVLKWCGPIVLVAGLIFAMYSHRYSPLSSTIWTPTPQKRKRAESSAQQRKTLDEILATLQTFTDRCDVLLDPFLRLTEYLSTQSSATSATTRPALTTLFVRILFSTPLWILLALPPFKIISSQRLLLVLGTLGLTWHSRPARVTRTILWRSHTIRRLLSLLTGLQFSPTTTKITNAPTLPPSAQTATPRGKTPGVRFTFTLYENQRRWWGLGWTSSLLPSERQAWTDDHANTCPEPSLYSLPEADNEGTRWRWVGGSAWRVEGAAQKVGGKEREKSAKRIGGGGGGDYSGWVYYDNSWGDGRREDGWGRYTRRRKWVRDAELVEKSSGVADEEGARGGGEAPAIPAQDVTETSSLDSSKKKSGTSWFSRGTDSTSPTSALQNSDVVKKPPPRKKNKSIDTTKSDGASVTGSVGSGSARSRLEGDEEDTHTPTRRYEWDRSIQEGMEEQLS